MSESVVVKRCDLTGVAEGFDESCYAYVRPADFKLMQEVNKLDPETDDDAKIVEFQERVVFEGFVTGKIKKFNGKEFDLMDMTSVDVNSTVGISNKLYSAIIGFDLDPKGLGKAAESTTLPQTDSKPTETPSSEA